MFLIFILLLIVISVFCFTVLSNIKSSEQLIESIKMYWRKIIEWKKAEQMRNKTYLLPENFDPYIKKIRSLKLFKSFIFAETIYINEDVVQVKLDSDPESISSRRFSRLCIFSFVIFLISSSNSISLMTFSSTILFLFLAGILFGSFSFMTFFF